MPFWSYGFNFAKIRFATDPFWLQSKIVAVWTFKCQISKSLSSAHYPRNHLPSGPPKKQTGIATTTTNTYTHRAIWWELNLRENSSLSNVIHIQYHVGNGFNIAQFAKGNGPHFADPRLWQIQLASLQLDREMLSRDQTFERGLWRVSNKALFSTLHIWCSSSPPDIKLFD